jgi:phosphoribosyl 1,2-cyclic phosphodiesterase
VSDVASSHSSLSSIFPNARSRGQVRRPATGDGFFVVSNPGASAVLALSYNRYMPDPYQTRLPSELRATFLGSGSSGNATAVSDGTTTVLVDCGFSAREVTRRLQGHGIDPASVAAILVTHEHTDHVCGVEVFARRHDSQVWASAGTRRAARFDAKLAEVHTLAAGDPVRIGSFEIFAFEASHDAAEPVGYVVQSDAGERFGLVTDTGVFTEQAAEALIGCDVVGIECNHDVEMLDSGPYPWFLKQRIASARGHLSNPDAALALERIASDRLRRVYAVHLSRTNNTHDLARAELSRSARRLGLDIEVVSVTQEGTRAPAARPPH